MREEELAHALGRGIRSLTRRPYAYGTSAALEELRVELDDGTRVELIAKAIGRAGLSEPARLSKPSFLFDPHRERLTYEHILGPRDLGTPAFHGIVDGRLVLEKVRGTELWQIGDVEVWLEVARWVAKMHDALVSSVDEPFLLRYDDRLYRRWLDGYEEVVGRLAALPATVIHGELYPSNILVAEGGHGMRIAAVDWETAAAGPRALDLAALATGWDDEVRGALIGAYHEASSLTCAQEELAGDVDRCQLFLALHWVARSREWTPPREHARDWVEEARRSATRLGIG